MEKDILEYFSLNQLVVKDKAAVIDDNGSISYFELTNKSNQIVKELHKKGICKGDKIGIYLENSREFIIATNVCIQLGCVCIPISVDSSVLRAVSIMKESKIQVVFTKEFFWKEIAGYLEDINLQYIFVFNEKDKFKEDIYGKLNNQYDFIYSSNNKKISNKIQENDSAYIIYTSGSTGRPKGVEIQYKSLINYVNETVTQFNLTEGSKILINNSFSFDASFGYIYCSLWVGATLVLMNRKILLPKRVLNKIREERITHYACTPSFLCELINIFKSIDICLLNLKVLSFGAENIILEQIKKVKDFKSQYPQIKIFNRYGPTETTIAVSAYEIKGDELNYIPLGKPYKNVQFFVLNDNGKEVNTNEVGELYIGGNQNMKGYYNDATLSKLVFIEKNGQRLYRTFDMVLYNEKKEYLFYSRVDDMLKRDGKRIYLSEIENILREVEGIENCACISLNNNNNVIVIGFIVTNTCKYKNQKYLLSNLRKEYPSYMIPNYIYRIDCIPRTYIGKVDKKYLLSIAIEKYIGGSS